MCWNFWALPAVLVHQLPSCRHIAPMGTLPIIWMIVQKQTACGWYWMFLLLSCLLLSFLQVLDVARGLQYLHSKDVIHGNINGVRILRRWQVVEADSLHSVIF